MNIQAVDQLSMQTKMLHLSRLDERSDLLPAIQEESEDSETNSINLEPGIRNKAAFLQKFIRSDDTIEEIDESDSPVEHSKSVSRDISESLHEPYYSIGHSQSHEKIHRKLSSFDGDISNFKLASIDDQKYENENEDISDTEDATDKGNMGQISKWPVVKDLREFDQAKSSQTLKELSDESLDIKEEEMTENASLSVSSSKKGLKWPAIFRNYFHKEAKDNVKKKSSSAQPSEKSKPFFKSLISSNNHVHPLKSIKKETLEEKKQVLKPQESDFTKSQREKFEREYTVKDQLGSGGHSTVRLAIRNKDGQKVVCKFIQPSSVWHWHFDKKTSKQIPLEIHILKLLKKENNPGIISYIDHFDFNTKFVIIMEYLGEDWVDLYDFVEIYGPVPEDISIEVFGKVVSVVSFLHNRNMCHNDIKDENVMINTITREIKLIDFGSLTSLDRGKTVRSFYGTKKFCSPEALKGSYLPEFQEVWALGTLLFVLLFKMDPFKNDDEVLHLDISKRIQRIRSYGVNGQEVQVSDNAVESLLKMLNKDWSKRPRVDQLDKLSINV